MRGRGPGRKWANTEKSYQSSAVIVRLAFDMNENCQGVPVPDPLPFRRSDRGLLEHSTPQQQQRRSRIGTPAQQLPNNLGVIGCVLPSVCSVLSSALLLPLSAPVQRARGCWCGPRRKGECAFGGCVCGGWAVRNGSGLGLEAGGRARDGRSDDDIFHDKDSGNDTDGGTRPMHADGVATASDHTLG